MIKDYERESRDYQTPLDAAQDTDLFAGWRETVAAADLTDETSLEIAGDHAGEPDSEIAVGDTGGSDSDRDASRPKWDYEFKYSILGYLRHLMGNEPKGPETVITYDGPAGPEDDTPEIPADALEPSIDTSEPSEAGAANTPDDAAAPPTSHHEPLVTPEEVKRLKD